MTVIACRMDCKNRSKRPLRKYKHKDGEKCYGCKLKSIVIARNMSEVKDVAGEEYMASCIYYEPIEKE